MAKTRLPVSTPDQSTASGLFDVTSSIDLACKNVYSGPEMVPLTPEPLNNETNASLGSPSSFACFFYRPAFSAQMDTSELTSVQKEIRLLIGVFKMMEIRFIF